MDSIIGVLLFIGVLAAITAFFNRDKSFSKSDRVRWRDETEIFVNNLIAGVIEPAKTSINLKANELPILSEYGTLFESKSSRIYAGAGTRIGKVYLGGGQSTSVKNTAKIDDGAILLSNTAIYFIGSKERRVINIKNILDVNPIQGALVSVTAENRQTNSCFKVNNPLLWMLAIKEIVSGNWRLVLQNGNLQMANSAYEGGVPANPAK